MPGTIKDDKSATANKGGLRYLAITLLAIVVSISLADGVYATSVSTYSAYPTPGLSVVEGYAKCRDATRFLDLNAYVNSMYSGSPKQFITSRHSCCGCYGNLNTGDYLDRWWYHNLDEGQYYYLDVTQYKLLGGLSYILGHPCYPKLYERRLEQAVGFIDIGGKGCLPWFDSGWDYLTVCEPGSLCHTGKGCIGQMPVSNYIIWHSCFKPGDHIQKFRYRYLDTGRYYFLDEIQYKWLGGLAYLFETPSIGNQYIFDYKHVNVSWHSDNSSNASDSGSSMPAKSGSATAGCLLNGTQEESGAVDMLAAVPEPASVLLMTLGTTIITLCRRKR
jgi:hypothetical protein